MLRRTSPAECLPPLVSLAVGSIRGRVTAASAPRAKSPAVEENTMIADSANRAAPTVGPTKLLIADWVANSRPLARSRSARSTSRGGTVSAALSTRVSAVPARNTAR